MRWPRQELETARPLRTLAAVRPARRHAARCSAAKNGWERANYFRPRERARPPYPHTLGKPDWLADVIDEQRATREAVALYDQTSFGKLLLQGRDALAVLQRLCANEMDVAPGRMVYTRAAERARRLRERPDGHPPRPSIASSSSPARRRRRATSTGSPGTSAPRIGGAHRRQRADLGALADGAERARAARPRRRARRPSPRWRPSGSSSRRRARSTSATRGSAPRA